LLGRRIAGLGQGRHETPRRQVETRSRKIFPRILWKRNSLIRDLRTKIILGAFIYVLFIVRNLYVFLFVRLSHKIIPIAQMLWTIESASRFAAVASVCDRRNRRGSALTAPLQGKSPNESGLWYYTKFWKKDVIPTVTCFRTHQVDSIAAEFVWSLARRAQVAHPGQNIRLFPITMALTRALRKTPRRDPLVGSGDALANSSIWLRQNTAYRHVLRANEKYKCLARECNQRPLRGDFFVGNL
jgi:hypothetical protein